MKRRGGQLARLVLKTMVHLLTAPDSCLISSDCYAAFEGHQTPVAEGLTFVEFEADLGVLVFASSAMTLARRVCAGR